MKGILFPLILGLLAVNFVSAGLDEDLVVYFTFDSVEGKKILDASDNQHDAEIVGKTKFVKGKHRNAIQITADTEEWVNVPTWQSLKISGEITMSAWVYREDWADGSGYWFDKGVYAGGVANKQHAYGMAVFQVKEAHWHLGPLKGTVITIILGGAGHQTRISKPLPKTENEKWHHVVGTYDGTFAKVYLDGELFFESLPINRDFPEVNDQALRIGCAKDRPQYAFDNGAIDEVALWSRSLTQTEIRTVMKGNMLAVSPRDKTATTWGDIKHRAITDE
ncbi:MAG: LamG domain-containing protein [Candidatus Poribacteria bacterium]|nr:LamG domain-containing protein [Candidatus Poribacteria bacterium]